jgi:hypothetical protein
MDGQELRFAGITITVPYWIDLSQVPHESLPDLTSWLRWVTLKGCASGLYMPSIESYTARVTMGEHGEDVIEYLLNHTCEDKIPALPTTVEGWGEIASFYLTQAIELWACITLDQIEGDND